MATLGQADAENKLAHEKLYLILDMDETLIHSRKMKAHETASGTQIIVHGERYDMVQRPGLQHFLRTVTRKYTTYLYTFGDEVYTTAVLEVIDPESEFFKGGVCCWRQGESRQHKSLSRVACDKRMTLIVDDMVDNWRDDLANLCLTRKFVGDASDDGLQLLSSQLHDVHMKFYSPSTGKSAACSLEDPQRQPPDVRVVLSEFRGKLLKDCQVALTGVVSDQTEESLASQPLCELIRRCGGQVTLNVDDSTHLVARKADGWSTSGKIRRAVQRAKTDKCFSAVWDQWLTEGLTSWKRQPEGSYAIPEAQLGRVSAAEPEVASECLQLSPNLSPTAPSLTLSTSVKPIGSNSMCVTGSVAEILGAVKNNATHTLPPAANAAQPTRKRLRDSLVEIESTAPRMTVREYIARQKALLPTSHPQMT